MSTTYMLSCNRKLMCIKKAGMKPAFFMLDQDSIYAFVGGLSNKAARINPAAASTAVG